MAQSGPQPVPATNLLDELKDGLKELRFQYERRAIRRVELYVLRRHADELEDIVRGLRKEGILGE